MITRYILLYESILTKKKQSVVKDVLLIIINTVFTIRTVYSDSVVAAADLVGLRMHLDRFHNMPEPAGILDKHLQ